MSFYEKAKEAVNEYVDNAKKVNAGNPRTWAGSNDRAQQNPGRAQVAALRAAEAKPSRNFIEVKTGTNTSGSQLDLNRLYPDFTGAVKRAAFHTNEPSPAEKQAEILARQVAFGKNVNPDARPESRTSLLLNPNATERNQRSTPTETPAAPGIGNWTGNYAASGPDGQGIYKDPQTGRTSIRLTGEAGDKFMRDQNKLIAEGKGKSTTAEDMAARRKAMGEYGGMFKQDAQEIPRTARPGITLQSTPVEYKREASGPKTVGGLPAEETFTPQPAQQQRAAMPTMTGNPLVDQRNMEAALQRKQMEVMQAERNDPTLLQAPGSRDYIDPRLTEPEQRARQLEITAQRTQDMRDVRDRIVAETQAQDAALAAKGLPTVEARNRAMEPYAERRATINQRGATASMAQEQERTKATVADNAATRDAETQRAQMTDATTRQGQAIDQETNRINAEIAAQSKAIDRETTLKAAMLKAENTKDPVLLKKLDGYNSWLESVMAMGQTPTPEQMTEAQKTYGVAELFAPTDPYAKLTIPAPNQQ